MIGGSVGNTGASGIRGIGNGLNSDMRGGKGDTLGRVCAPVGVWQKAKSTDKTIAPRDAT